MNDVLHAHKWQRMVPRAVESAVTCSCGLMRAASQICECDDVAGDYPWCPVHEYEDQWPA